MLEHNRGQVGEFRRADLAPDDDFAGLIRSALGFWQRRKATLVAIVLLAMALGAGYILIAPAYYRASAMLLLNTTPLVSEGINIQSDSALIDTQVEILRSDNIALAAIRSLHLTDESFSGGTVYSEVLAPLLAARRENSADSSEQRILKELRKNLSVRRVGLSYVIEVSFDAPSPSLAAHVANGILAAYMGDQVNARMEASREASNWLKRRIAELTEYAGATHSALTGVQVRNGSSMSSADKGEIGARQEELGELTRELEQARADIEAERSKLASNGRDLSASSRGYEAARQREAILQARLEDLIRASVESTRGRALLAGAESDAFRTAYNALMQRLVSVQRDALPFPEARVITRASEPTSRNSPKPFYVLGGALGVGLLLGTGAAFLRDNIKVTFGDRNDIERMLGVPFLGLVPRVKRRSILRATRTLARARTGEDRPEKYRRPSAELDPHQALLSYVTMAPSSSFAEAMRRAKLELWLPRAHSAGAVIGFTSAFDGEGKTTLANNFAELLASGGNSVVVVDVDLRSEVRNRSKHSDSTPGLVDLLSGSCSVDAATFRGANNAQKISSTWAPVANSADLLSSREMHALIEDLRHRYDAVVLDVAPLVREVDVRAIEPVVDVFALVIEWRKTKITQLQGLYSPIQAKTGGVLLNKARVAEYSDGHRDGTTLIRLERTEPTPVSDPGSRSNADAAPQQGRREWR